METRQLRHFLAVAEKLHFGRAAELLGMTQPPLSQSIMALEKELGAPLFNRTKRRVTLTPFGELWLKPVRSALGELDALPETARRMRDGEEGCLELSFVSTADYNILPALVRTYTELFPAVEITLTEATSDVQVASLLEGIGHIGIIIEPASGSLPDALLRHKLVSEPLIAAVPQTWINEGRLKLSRGKLPANAVIAAPLIIFPRRVAPAFYDLVMDYYLSRNTRAQIAQYAIQMQTIISLVSAGMGIALVPASLRNLARTGVVYVDLQERAPQLETIMVWRKSDMAPALKNFLEVSKKAISIARNAKRS